MFYDTNDIYDNPYINIENLIETYSNNNPYYLIYMDLMKDKNKFSILDSPNSLITNKGIIIY